MNKKIVIGLIVLLLGGLGFLFIATKKGTAPTQNSMVNETPTPASSEFKQPTQTTSPSPTSSPSGMMAQEVTVTLTASGFNPQTITIKKGTKVTWVNKSGQTATVNSDPHPIHTAYPPLNLGKFDDGQSLSLVFNDPGTYGYHNHLNSSETGKIIVQ